MVPESLPPTQMDPDALSKRVHATLNEFLSYKTVTKEQYSKLESDIATYFTEYRAQYNKEPSPKNCWFAKYLDMEYAFSEQHYISPSDPLYEIELHFEK
jgi:hypothetical protein